MSWLVMLVSLPMRKCEPREDLQWPKIAQPRKGQRQNVNIYFPEYKSHTFPVDHPSVKGQCPQLIRPSHWRHRGSVNITSTHSFKTSGNRTTPSVSHGNMSDGFPVYLFLPDGQRKDQDSLSWLLGGWAKYLPIISGRVRYDSSQLIAVLFSGQLVHHTDIHTWWSLS